MRRRRKQQTPNPPTDEATSEKPATYYVADTFTWDGTAGRRFFIRGSRVAADDPIVLEVLAAGGNYAFVREDSP